MAIDPKQFLSGPEELHALVIGFCEVICPWPPFRQAMSQPRADELANEYHYYVLGRGIGIFAWLGIAGIVKVVFF